MGGGRLPVSEGPCLLLLVAQAAVPLVQVGGVVRDRQRIDLCRALVRAEAATVPPEAANGLGDALAEAVNPRLVRRVVRRDNPQNSDGADVLRLGALLALRGVELDALVLIEALVAAIGDGGEVDEDVLAAVVGGDEAEALLAVEPLHGALGQCHVLLRVEPCWPRTPCAW